MRFNVRPMDLDEASIIPDYFHGSSPEDLELLGVDPTRLPHRDTWLRLFEAEYEKPLQDRAVMLVLWLGDNRPVGFSTADKIAYGHHANMHLHVIDPAIRGSGVGTTCVRATAALYFRELQLDRLFCEPNAFNVAPNRTLQRAGFRYVKTHWTVPGPLNFHQAVTRWVLDAATLGGPH